MLRYTDWETPPINQLSPLPSNRKPIKGWSDRDEAFLEVVKGIREAARSVANSNSSPPKQTTQELEERQYQVTSLINEADRLHEAKKFEEAAVKYKAALRLDPNSIIAHNSLGNALSDQGKLSEAIAAYQRALLIDPNDAIAHYNLGIALYGQGKLEKAIAAYQRALLIDPNDAIAHNNLGIALSDQGKLEEGIAELEIAVRLNPTSTLFRNNLEIYRNKKKGFWGRLFGG
ncbi:tetratricopeptide repeat protein [Nostoc sp. UIC 10630]|uniref:tetratricopeptide repeat protein n=1 Tax=Nostoc sp. UIC 10630 TaxID=2100146 RepID=UPI001932306C|nr:tetratricopeptide repeat protein [Nostoc sp. UIC 10630]